LTELLNNIQLVEIGEIGGEKKINLARKLNFKRKILLKK